MDNSHTQNRTPENYAERFGEMRTRMLETGRTGHPAVGHVRFASPPSASTLSQLSRSQMNQSRVSPMPSTIGCAINYQQIRSNIDQYIHQLPNPQRMIAFYPPRPQLPAPRNYQERSSSNANNRALVPLTVPKGVNIQQLRNYQWSQQQQMIASNIERGKLVAKQTLNSIAPVEYVERVRKMSKPILDNRKVLQQMVKDKIGKIASKPRKKRRYFLFSLVVAFFSLFMFATQDLLIRETMDYVMGEIKEGSMVAKSWQNVPLPINFCFYFFGLKNGPEFLQGAKPFLKEYGPFCYHLSRKRRILEWKEKTVTYMERLHFKFVPEDSKSLDTKLHMINYPIFIAVLFAKSLLETFYVSFLGPIVYNAISVALRMTGESLVDYTTARLLLEGKPIRILEYVDLFLKPIRAVGVPIPQYFGAGGLQLLNHSFGFTSTLGSGEVGPFEVFTRTEHSHLVGDIHNFQDKRVFPTWKSPCNLMAGGDGMFWRRPVEDDRLTMFIQIACRLVPFVKDYEHTFQGAQVIRYQFDPQMFNMSLKKNQCFCHKSRTLSQCDGWHDISPCLGWLPVGYSFPHFYQSPNLLRKVEGLTPTEEEHQGFLDMEPLIAAPVNARIGIQGLINVEPVSSVPSMSSLPRVPLPIVWFKVHAGAYGPLAILLFVGSNAVRYGSYAWLVGGLGFAAFLFFLGNRQRKQQKNVSKERQK